MINLEKKERKLSILQKNIKYLKGIQKMDYGLWLVNYEKILATHHAIQESSQICIDLGFHICAVNHISTPNNYREVFVLLAQNNLIDKILGINMQKWASLRNVITHLYDKVDDRRIFSILEQDLGDLDDFVKFIHTLEEI